MFCLLIIFGQSAQVNDNHRILGNFVLRRGTGSGLQGEHPSLLRGSMGRAPSAYDGSEDQSLQETSWIFSSRHYC